ncbi:MAG: hypothetical protein ACI4MF_12415, partial [Candidatus Faecivicinus sp.]
MQLLPPLGDESRISVVEIRDSLLVLNMLAHNKFDDLAGRAGPAANCCRAFGGRISCRRGGGAKSCVGSHCQFITDLTTLPATDSSRQGLRFLPGCVPQKHPLCGFPTTGKPQKIAAPTPDPFKVNAKSGRLSPRFRPRQMPKNTFAACMQAAIGFSGRGAGRASF